MYIQYTHTQTCLLFKWDHRLMLFLITAINPFFFFFQNSPNKIENGGKCCNMTNLCHKGN